MEARSESQRFWTCSKVLIYRHYSYYNYEKLLLPVHFQDIDGELSDHNVGNINIIVKNSDSDLVTSCFIRILIGITRSLRLYFMLGF